FEEVEKRIIKHQSMRIVDVRVQVQAENVLSIKTYASKLSEDKRKYEWVVLNNEKRGREVLFWVKRENLIGVVQKLGIKHGKKVLVITKEIVGFKAKNKEKELFKSETRMKNNIQVF
ncbi:45970_t:CDS:2, partial [Gigaspora margarita]